MAHYLNDDWDIVSNVLQTRAVFESHTDFHLAELLSNVVKEWQLREKAVVIVTVATLVHESHVTATWQASLIEFITWAFVSLYNASTTMSATVCRDGILYRGSRVLTSWPNPAFMTML